MEKQDTEQALVKVCKRELSYNFCTTIKGGIDQRDSLQRNQRRGIKRAGIEPRNWSVRKTGFRKAGEIRLKQTERKEKKDKSPTVF